MRFINPKTDYAFKKIANQANLSPEEIDELEHQELSTGLSIEAIAQLRNN